VLCGGAKKEGGSVQREYMVISQRFFRIIIHRAVQFCRGYPYYEPRYLEFRASSWSPIITKRDLEQNLKVNIVNIILHSAFFYTVV
jgi:hypothetical protein